MEAYRITLDDGSDSYVTSFNGNLIEAREYFLGQANIIENFETGAETVRIVTRVEPATDDE